MKINWGLLITTIIFLAIGVISFTVMHHEKKIAKCRANFIISNYDLEASVVATVIIEKDHGVIFYDGPLLQHEVIKGYLSRKVSFSIETKNKITLLHNTSIIKFKKDDVEQLDAERILPDFFVKPKAEIFFDIVREQNGYFFIKDSLPIFYCRDMY